MRIKTRSGLKAEEEVLTSEIEPVDNARLAELLAREAEHVSGHVQKAFRRAARAAVLWPEEASTLLRQGRSLTELPGIGPHLEKRLRNWLETPPPAIDPPASRRNFLSLVQARRVLSRRPDWVGRMRGDLQMHSTWSDGAGTIAQMAEAGRDKGYEYIAITDHSAGLKIAGGLEPAELAKQATEIKGVNETFQAGARPIRVLRSVELNLSPGGEGDMPSSSLEKLDVVIGSFHSALRKKEDQTERYVAALRNPDIQILGHPRGRIYNYREGLPADWARVFAEALRWDKAIEVDSYPDRQDIDLELLALARRMGIRIAIDTDAHSPAQLDFIQFGLGAALLSGIDPERIVNFMSASELCRWVATVRESHRLSSS